MLLKSDPLKYQPEMKKIVTSNPTVTLMVTRIPSTITEEGLANIFIDFNVLNLRLVINKGGFAGVRGLNYAYITVADNAEAVIAIEKLNMQPPLNLGVVYKPSEEERIKTREQDLLERAFPINDKDLGKDKISESKTTIPREQDQVLIDEASDCMGSLDIDNVNEVKNENSGGVFMFNSPLVINNPDPTIQNACWCGNIATLVCSRCTRVWYCSQHCQIERWPGHKFECDGQLGGVEGNGDEDNNMTIEKSVKKRVVSKKHSNSAHSDKETGTPKSIEESPLLDSASIESKESSQSFGPKNLSLTQRQATDCGHVMKIDDTPCPSIEDQEELRATVKNGDEDVHSEDESVDKKLEVDEIMEEKLEAVPNNRDVSVEKSSFDKKLEVDDLMEKKLGAVPNIRDVSGENASVDKQLEVDELMEKNLEPVPNIKDASGENVDIVLHNDESEEDPTFQSILTFEKDSECDVRSRTETNKTLKGSNGSNPKISLSSMLQPTWTKVISCVSDVYAPILHVVVEGAGQVIQVKLGRVNFKEPWGKDNRDILNTVLGEGREEQVQLWVKSVGWEGDLQIVDIKDEEDNDVATLLTKIGITELIGKSTNNVPASLMCCLCENLCKKAIRSTCTSTPVCLDCAVREITRTHKCWDCGEIGVTIDDHLVMDQAEVEEYMDMEMSQSVNPPGNDSNVLHGDYNDIQDNFGMSEIAQPDLLITSDVERGSIADGTLVRLKDIGNTSQEGLVRCVEEKERLWLEEVMELSDTSSSILTPVVGQLVAFRLITRLGTKVARAEVLKVNHNLRKVQCQCLDYHDRRWEDYDKLFQPPPACLSIPPLCSKVLLLGVPDIERKEAKVMLEKVDQTCLSQPLTLRVIENGLKGQLVELLDAEGNSINEIMAKGLIISKHTEPSNKVSLLTSSPTVPHDYTVLSSYVPIPMNTTVPVIILHVESPTDLFVCPVSKYGELNDFQAYLQTLGNVGEQGTPVTPVVGQLILVRSNEDKQWYRGTVIKIHKARAKVYCPDFGFVEKVPVCNLRSLNDSDVIKARYWASHCCLVDWEDGKEDTTAEEVERIKKLLVAPKEADIQVINNDSVNLIIDICGINRYVL